MMDDHDYEMTCPYDMSHTVKKSRMQFHLKKCRSNKAKQEKATSNRERPSMVRCLYNAAHDVEAFNYEKHCESCPDRGQVMTWATIRASAQASSVKASTPAIKLPDSEENWDDSEHPTYDPTAKNLTKAIYRTVVGESRSVRRHFRAEERVRFINIETDVAVGGGGAEVPDEAASVAPPLVREAKPVFNFTEPLRTPLGVSTTFSVPEAVPRFEPGVHGMGRGRPVNSGEAGQPLAGRGAGGEVAGRGAGCNGAIKKVVNGAAPKKKNKKKMKNKDTPPAYVGLPPPPAAANGDAGVDGAVRLMASLGVGPGDQAYGDWISTTAASGARGEALEWTSMAQLPSEGPANTGPGAYLTQSDPGRGRGRLQQQLKEKRDQYDRL